MAISKFGVDASSTLVLNLLAHLSSPPAGIAFHVTSRCPGPFPAPLGTTGDLLTGISWDPRGQNGSCQAPRGHSITSAAPCWSEDSTGQPRFRAETSGPSRLLVGGKGPAGGHLWRLVHVLLLTLVYPLHPPRDYSVHAETYPEHLTEVGCC